jgi:hypothetical protein
VPRLVETPADVHRWEQVAAARKSADPQPAQPVQSDVGFGTRVMERWETERLRNIVAARAQATIADAGLSPALGALLDSQPEAIEVLTGARTAADLAIDDRLLPEVLLLLDSVRRQTSLHLSLTRVDEGKYCLVNGVAFGERLCGRPFPGHRGRRVFAPKDAYGPTRWVATARAMPEGHPYREALFGETTPNSIRKHAVACWQQSMKGEPPRFARWPGRIEDVAIITRDRPDRLEATLRAHCENLARYHRDHVRITIWDDSTGEAAAANRKVVTELSQKFGRDIQLVGPEDKQRMRSALEKGLQQRMNRPKEEVSQVLDRILGAFDDSGAWVGSESEQRNWVSLYFSGKRVMVGDDDATPFVRDNATSKALVDGAVVRASALVEPRGRDGDSALVSLPAQAKFYAGRSTAIFEGTPLDVLLVKNKLTPEELATVHRAILDPPADLHETQASVVESLRHFLEVSGGDNSLIDPRGRGHELHSVDLLGRFEELGPGLFSAGFTGHGDRAAQTLLLHLTKTNREPFTSGQVGASGLPRGDKAPEAWSQFRGGIYVTSGSLEGLELTLRRQKDSDFTLARTLKMTSSGDVPTETPWNLWFYHERGPRLRSAARVLRQEGESTTFNRLLDEAKKAYQETLSGPKAFDAIQFAQFARKWIPQNAERLVDMGSLGAPASKAQEMADRADKHAPQVRLALESLEAPSGEGDLPALLTARLSVLYVDVPDDSVGLRALSKAREQGDAAEVARLLAELGDAWRWTSEERDAAREGNLPRIRDLVRIAGGSADPKAFVAPTELSEWLAFRRLDPKEALAIYRDPERFAAVNKEVREYARSRWDRSTGPLPTREETIEELRAVLERLEAVRDDLEQEFRLAEGGDVSARIAKEAFPRVLKEVDEYLQSIPYGYALQAELPQLARQGRSALFTVG